ncbi:Echinoderm microtubule-associated protein-like 6 [Allomyces arbusculus]|nr:Echinoderm microtubule-associated protein-like 6 [Allomyces arbusculus]
MGNGLALPSLLRQPDATDSAPQQHAPDLPAGHSPLATPRASATLPRLFRPFTAPDPPANMSGKRAPTTNAATRGDAIFNAARGALTASTPENYTAPDPSTPPSHTLRVRRVAGYRIHDARHNLFFTGPHTAVFPAAAVGVVQDLRSPSQRFCSAHDDDVVALTFHRASGLVATGQVGVSPAVHVWRAAEPESPVASFAMPKGSKAVAAVAFSHDARFLVVAAADNDHTLCVFDVQSGKVEPVATTKGGSSAIVDLACAPSSSDDRVFEFVAVGQKSVRFWTVSKASIGTGLALNSKNGVFGGITGSNDPEPVNSVVYLPAQAVYATGTQSGHVIAWSPTESKAVRLLARVHNAQVFALAVAENGCLVSGSKDGLVQVWTPNLDPAAAPLSFPAGVRAIDADPTASTLLVGLEDGTVATTSHGRVTVHVAGHKCANDAEVWALATRGDVAVTAGDDAQLLVWDVTSGTVRARAELPAGGARAVAIHPNADLVAVGLNSGAIQHRRLSQPDQVVAPDVTVSSKRITVMAFSPDGSKLAVGAADSNITVLTNGTVSATVTAHSAAVTALDWSTDSTYLQSNSADYELLFTRVEHDGTAAHDPDASNARNLDWSTYTLPIGWATRGVWTPGQDGTDINAVARGGPGLVAIATDKGHVEVVNWPAPTAGHVTARHVGKVHAAHVTNVRWANGERTAVSAGGRDGCVVFWDVVPVA